MLIFVDMPTHQSSFQDRISHGNSLAAQVLHIINKSPDYPYFFAPANLSADLQGIDAVCLITGKTCQVKVRQSGPDVIIEHLLLYPLGDTFRVELGRDRLTADLYICRSHSGGLVVLLGEMLRELVAGVRLPEMDDIWWAIQGGQSHHMETGVEGVEAVAKLDMGHDGPKYGKVLLFFKP